MAKTKATTKKLKPAAARRGKRAVDRAWRDDTRASNGVIPAVMPDPVTTNAAPPSAPVGRPRLLARLHRKSPVQKMGGELVRYLRIHSKHPYGTRGQKAILDLAARAASLALQESKTLADVYGHNLLFVEESLTRLQPDHEVTVATTGE